MFRLNILRNSSIVAKNLFVPKQSSMTCLRSSLSSTGMNCPFGKSNLDNGSSQKSLLQVAKSISPAMIQSRSSSGGDHVRLWQMERIASAALIPLFPGIFLMDSKIMETALSAIVVMHTYWGIEAIIVDYLRPAVVGPTAPKVAKLLLFWVSAVMLSGLLVLIYSGDGIANAVKKGWAIGQEPNGQ